MTTITVTMKDETELDINVNFKILPGQEQTFWEPGCPDEIDSWEIDPVDLIHDNFTSDEIEIAVEEYVDENEAEIIEKIERDYEEEKADYLYEQMMDMYYDL